MGDQQATFQYTNRKGVIYHLHRILGPGGRMRYTLKRSAQDALLELPGEYEVVENVNGQASVRRRRPRLITTEEETTVRSSLTHHGLDRYRLEIKDHCLTIFEPDHDPAKIVSRFNPLGMMPAGIGQQLEAMVREQVGNAEMDRYLHDRREDQRGQIEAMVQYSPVLRFNLVDREDRSFRVERMTYRGEGGWHPLGVMPLAKAASRFMEHLGRESFFELW